MTARYIALEGVEGAGKTTMAAAVAARLEAAGHQVTVVREPGGTAVGEGVRNLLLHSDGSAGMSPWTEAMLFAAQRAELAVEVIGPALERGEWVVSDRSYYSSLAYQGGARGLGIERVRVVNELGLAGVVPDLVVVLAVDPTHGLSRQEEPDRIGSQGVEFLSRVAEAYTELATAEPHRVVIVDASGLPEEVLDRLMAVIGA